MHSKAQGALEYMLLIGGAVLIAAIVITIIVASGSSAQCKPQKEALKIRLIQTATVYLDFDEGSGGATKDLTINGNNGNITGASWQPSGCISGPCLQFDGVNDYVEIGTANIPSGASARTLEVWVKPVDAGTDYDTILNEGSYAAYQEFQIGVSNQKFNANWYIDGIQDSSSYTFGEWYHVAATYNGADARLYKNGVLVAGPSAVTLNTVIGKVRAGANPNGTENFNGAIDKVRIYNRALTAEEIKEHYEKEKC